jgi:uncharacterized membrane protein YoaK (UPF0700 family)
MSAPRILTHDERRHVLFQEYLALQHEQEEKGAMPVRRTVLFRLAWLFEFLGAISVGMLCAAFAVLAVFLVTRVIFHIDLTRYFTP